ncbi:Rha family transcriptional regulator [Ligilactobacillus apodemi]|uniref:Uncharacterized protein n=1 Tax=Ligilactobacillus apodemi DSM 16634 = JCM 16172 TaxID=1423724 RepID=A0A0R1TRN4_9LACO|nr:Rha family transcriptional regulator [Ligilactobacillus apodemi]KRL84077.1 hypothetical protein FC32_GL001354 [Ligilactobacillus apodemi DSM 16634 = JCM 16172]
MTLEEYFYPGNFPIMKRKNKHGLYITSQDLAELLGIKHRSVKRSILENKELLNKYRPLRSYGKSRKYKHGGAPEFVYYLTEEQAIFLILNARSTKKSLKLKEMAIDYIFKTREAVNSYNHISNLLYKAVTGMNAKQLKKTRNPKVKASLDVLTSEEQEQYKQLETRVIGYLLAQMTFDQIKAMLNGGTLQVTEWREAK